MGTTVIVVIVPAHDSGPAPWWVWMLAGVALVAVLWMAGIVIKDLIGNRNRSGH